MSAQPKPNEPSMEDILASIRRIIADDEAKPAPVRAEAPLYQPPAITVVEDPELEAVPEPLPEPEPDDVLDLGLEASRIEEEPTPPVAEPEDIDFAEPAPEPVLATEPPAVARPDLDMTTLISERTSAAVTTAFGELAHTVLTNNARTLEDLVKDMLKPMLRNWLDDNLPAMVERLVRAEIERVARGGRR